MKVVEIIIRLLDEILTAIKVRKAQNERTKLEQTPDSWFRDHFGGGVQSNDADKTNKTDTIGKA
jgi:hypothetical protein